MLAAQRDDFLAGLPGFVGDGGLVVGVVERRADIVGHAAIDRHVLADARQRLQDAHGVQRDAGRGHKRAARFHQKARQGQVMALA